ncbi:HEPN domain-containing protein [Novosphingobium sp. ST904]|uniref:HEPN domain-containing protein n=1 Tax=Novosphingobium sp. ST904 TaxID=1684385 RepID=UPI0006C832AD|nr:HEPN domain-containing protein [Novosphingobium sp. ST904]KPH67136.1 nucleotidyltransferase [Novosphingobium sp. ST904]TCM24927.1 putative nucleotidyltransferase [Novosphingobium sp. ST904]
MRTDIDHLPPHKQRELDLVVEMLFQGLRDATGKATGRRKSGRILKIILFGSYARGDWVDAPLDANQYKSDYDLLVIVNQKDLTDRAAYWDETEQRIVTAYNYEKTLRTPANFVVHSLQEVNDALAHGRLFFMNILSDGALLYESDDKPLKAPVPKSPETALTAAEEYFAEYMADAAEFFGGYQDAFAREHYRKAAFDLHQTVENLYQGLLLTFTFYTPYDHNILFLRDMAEEIDHSLFDVWPRGTRREKALYQKLKDAYRKARYSRHYKISREDLEWLAGHAEVLGQRVHALCQARIEEMRRAVTG